MLINILITILGSFFVLAFESFFITLFGFSIFIIVSLVLIGRIDWKKWLLLVVIISFLIDILLHRGVGVTLLSASISTGILYLLFMLIPKKEVLLSHIPYLISVFVFYLCLSLVNPLVQSGLIGSLTWGLVLGYFVKSLISAVIIWGINILMDNFRSDNKISL